MQEINSRFARNSILIGDANAKLATLPSASIDIRVPTRGPRGHARTKNYRYLPEHARPSKRGVADNLGLNRTGRERRNTHPLGKNPGDVWQLATANFRGPHFAAFPLTLAERPLLATCPEKTCAACGTPWVRERVDRTIANPGLGELRPRCLCNAATTASGPTPSISLASDAWVMPRGGVGFVWVLENEAT